MKKYKTDTIETERLILRKLTMEDKDVMYNSWCRDKEVVKYLPWSIHESIKVTEDLLSFWMKEYEVEGTYRWGITIKDNNLLIGTIDVVFQDDVNYMMEIGYASNRLYWGNGYMTEALKAVLDYLFNHTDVHLIMAKHEKSNTKSGRVMQKAGLSYDGTLRERILNKDNKYDDLVYYSILRDEYFNNK